MCKVDIKIGDTSIDPCMRNLIYFVKEIAHYETFACCCGHSKYPMTIVVKSKVDGRPIEILTKTPILRKKRFYKRDKQGVYYIPEVK
jgi:hypothetical protein